MKSQDKSNFYALKDTIEMTRIGETDKWGDEDNIAIIKQ